MSAAPASPPNPAEAYESYLVPAMFGPWAAELVERAAPQPGERVLDLACGTGVVARRCAPLVAPTGRVEGLDINPVMLGVAETAASRDGAAITYQQGNMEALPFPDGAFDLVTCQQGLQFVPNRAAAVSEMRRVLAAGGRAVIECWSGIENQTLAMQLSEVVGRHIGPSAFNAPYGLGDAEELRALCSAAGFTDVRIETVDKELRFPNLERYVAMSTHGSVAAIPAIQQMSPEERERLIAALRADIMPVLAPFIDGDAVVTPSQAHIVSARG